MFLSVISWQDNEIIFVWLDYEIFSPWKMTSIINILLSSVNILWRKDHQHAVLVKMIFLKLKQNEKCIDVSPRQKETNNFEDGWFIVSSIVVRKKSQKLKIKLVGCGKILWFSIRNLKRGSILQLPVAIIETVVSDIWCLDIDFVPLGDTRDTRETWLTRALHTAHELIFPRTIWVTNGKVRNHNTPDTPELRL